MNLTPTAIRLFLRHARPHSFSECWEWGGVRIPTGYGYFSFYFDGKSTTRSAHRASYTLFRGPIPEGLHLDHLCRNRGCVNPCHLEAVTLAENNRRALPSLKRGEDHPQGRKTHCPQGHPYDEVNTYHYGGRRYCRICKAAHVKACRDRRAAA